jgi:hypothetical protein
VARWIVPFIGWSLAVMQHALWNGSLTFLNSLLAAFFFLALGFVSVFVIWRVTLRRERSVLTAFLADEVSAGVLTPAEYAMLSDDRARRRVLRAARRREGRAGRQRQRMFNQAAAELAFRKFHLSNGELPKGTQRRTPDEGYREVIRALRAQLPSGDFANAG